MLNDEAELAELKDEAGEVEGVESGDKSEFRVSIRTRDDTESREEAKKRFVSFTHLPLPSTMLARIEGIFS